MGKLKNKKVQSVHRHNPLDKEILETRFAQPSSRQKTRSKISKDDKFVDDKLASEIIKQARKQQEDLEEEYGLTASDLKPQSSLDSKDSTQEENEAEEEYSLSSSEDEKILQITAEIKAEDNEAFERFMSANLEKRESLADILKETLTEKKTEICSMYSDAGSHVPDENEKTFKDLAPFLKNYRSGKIPKAFKRIPDFADWEHKVMLTDPENWSSAAMYQATRIFASNLEDKKAQRFYNRILLPRCRDEIKEHLALNFHLYQAVKKALFKPAAFFKGIILPLCKTESTLREATIFASILAKCSIPVLHSSAALLSIAVSEYHGANIIIMRTLIEKKYALPYRVVNALVDYFLGFRDKDMEKIPVLWHQCLLSFVQIYKYDLSPEQKKSLSKLLEIHRHADITPEIRKELQEADGLPTVLQQLWKI